MNYSLEKIDTLAGCDLLVTSAQKKKNMLERKRRNLGEAIDAFGKRLERLNEALAEVQAVLAAYTTAYHAIPEGSKYKASINAEVKRLALRLARLQMSALTCNVRALLSKQLLYNRLDAQVAAVEYYITAVEAKKTALSEAVLRITYATPDLRPPVVHLKSRFNVVALSQPGCLGSLSGFVALTALQEAPPEPGLDIDRVLLRSAKNVETAPEKPRVYRQVYQRMNGSEGATVYTTR